MARPSEHLRHSAFVKAGGALLRRKWFRTGLAGCKSMRIGYLNLLCSLLRDSDIEALLPCGYFLIRLAPKPRLVGDSLSARLGDGFAEPRFEAWEMANRPLHPDVKEV